MISLSANPNDANKNGYFRAQKLREIEEISLKSAISNPISYSLTLLLLKIQ